MVKEIDRSPKGIDYRGSGGGRLLVLREAGFIVPGQGHKPVY